MELRRRFRYMSWTIILIPLFSILITVFAFLITWSLATHESDDLRAPRYLKPALREILTTGSLEAEVEGFKGIIAMFDSVGQVVYADPLVKEAMSEKQWNTMADAYRALMEEMPPSHPFSFSVYRYQGEPGVVLYFEEYFTNIKLFRVLGIILFGLYFILIVLPVLMLGKFMRPLQESLLAMERAAGEIGHGNLDHELILPERKKLFFLKKTRPHPPVLDNLITSFENMRRELKENHERQSRIMMSVSHDLKTPLTLIKGYVEALKDGMAETPEEVIQYAEVIHDRAGLLEDRISDLIHFSKLLTTDWQARFEPIDLQVFLGEMDGIFKNDTFIRKRTYGSELNIPEGTFVQGDRKMLFQVIENIFDNSCRYTGEEDTIRVTAEVQDDPERADEDVIVIRIEDSGPGVGEEHIPHIFDHYYRADSGRNSRGTGMGLASAKIIARNHGGDIIYIPSGLGGAGFELTLPVLPDPSYNKGDG